jgi:glycosyltransferase involved in cell wall biosynthesis
VTEQTETTTESSAASPSGDAEEQGVEPSKDPAAPVDGTEEPLLSVIMPAYNEIETLESVVQRVLKVGLPVEIIMVDDGSTDGTRELMDELVVKYGVRAVKHEKNQGKGAALQTGFQHATGDLVIVQDADLEYDPNDYHLILRPFLEQNADVVYGSRYLVGRYTRVHPYYHYMGNRFLTFISNVFTGLKLTDMETCYKCFTREVVQDLKITSKRFTVEPEITARIAKKRLKIFEVPISYLGRDYSDGKKIGWKDGVAAIYSIIKFRFWG